MFKTQWNYKNSSGEANNKPSLTIPNQVMGIRDMYKRLASGQPVSINPNLRYTGDEFIPNFEMMDPVERDQYIEKIAQENEHNKKVQAELDEKNKAESEAKEQELFQTLLKKFQETGKTPQGEGSGETA